MVSVGAGQWTPLYLPSRPIRHLLNQNAAHSWAPTFSHTIHWQKCWSRLFCHRVSGFEEYSRLLFPIAPVEGEWRCFLKWTLRLWFDGLVFPFQLCGLSEVKTPQTTDSCPTLSSLAALPSFCWFSSYLHLFPPRAPLLLLFFFSF